MTSTTIRQIRKMMGLTQRELGQKLGFTVQQISNYETGRARLPKVVELALFYLLSHESYDEAAFSSDWNRKDMEIYDAL